MPRLDRQAKKRADLEMLSTLLQLTNQFGPEQTQREELGEESIREARLRNTGLEMGLPFLGREAEARVGTAEDERGYAREKHPVAMKSAELENLFAEQTMDPRRQMVETQAALAQGMMAPTIQGAEQAVSQGAERHPLDMRGLGIQNDFNAARLKYMPAEIEQQQLATDVQAAQGIQNLGAVSGAQYDLMPWLTSRNKMPMPKPAGQSPMMDDAQLFQTLQARGLPMEVIQQLLRPRR